MFEKLRINKYEQQNFERNLLVKGEYLIKQIYDVLLDGNAGQDVLWNDVLAILKYDKRLRDKLYIFLATFEEYLKAEIFRKYDVSSRSIIYDKYKLKELKNDILKKVDDTQSNLYFCFKLELGPIIDLIESKQMFDVDYIKKIKIVKDLRNKVMHHQVLLLGQAITYNQAKEEIVILEKELEALYELMPNDEYKRFFQDALNKQKEMEHLDKIKLREMVDGIFVKS